ncbi:MAG TPA: DMT family transporter [Reyranella sp.]|nr:DMT family transporter [Reyranella sp.]
MAGAFAAMLFVGAAWGINLPITKVMLGHFDLIPMATLRTAVATAALAGLIWLVEGRRALRVDLGVGRFLALGFILTSFFFAYALGLYWSNPITAATIQVAGPLISAATVRLVTGQRFDPGFGVALGLSLLGGAILSSSSLFGSGPITFGGGEVIVLLSSGIWTLYALKAQAWFDRASQLHRTYVASLSSTGWLILGSIILIALGFARSPFGAGDSWIWTQLLITAFISSGLGTYGYNFGASRLGVAVASLWVNLTPFFAVLWSMAYGFMPNAYHIVGGLVALLGVVYMQGRKLAMQRT